MIPDKIYVCVTTPPIALACSEVPWVNKENNFEYIRKDALLEWLEQNRTQAQMWFDRYNDREDLSAKQVWEEVIGKLNEM